MKNLTMKNIADITGGTIYVSGAADTERLSTQEVDSIVTDSRKAAAGSLFVAIVGERADGHRFLPQVAEQCASAMLSELTPDEIGEKFGYGPEITESIPVIVVKSTLQAVKDIAEFYLKQLQIPIIGIVGSVGKTSTKEMVAHVLEQKFRILKTEGNFNNELGVPMTVFRLREEHEAGVLEMGINHFGEMHRLAKIVRPDTVIMTNIGTAHLEFLESRDGILKAKSEVFDYFKPTGHIILNGDDDKLSLIEEKNGVIPIRFGLERKGFSHDNDVWAENIRLQGLKGTSCTIHTPAGSFEVLIPNPGRHMVQNALAGAAAGYVYGLSMDQIRQGIENYRALNGRFNILYEDKITIIDDCYNANPGSVKAALDILQDGEGRRIAVLGDMGELGKDEIALHESIGKYAVSHDVDLLCCAGPLSAYMAEAAQKEAAERGSAMEIRHFADGQDLAAHISEFVRTGDIVLVKASHYMGFECIVDELKKYN